MINKTHLDKCRKKTNGHQIRLIPCNLKFRFGTSGSHVAAVNVPAVHEDVPDTVYPESHVGWQVLPDAKLFVQFPAAPLSGAALASQGSEVKIIFKDIISLVA